MIGWCILICVGCLMVNLSWPLTDLDIFGHPGMVPKEIQGLDEKLYRYIIYVPREYGSDFSLPLIVFLHGAGFNGSDGRQQLMTGLAPEICSRHVDFQPFPYFVLFPQARRSWVFDSNDRRAVITILDRTLTDYRVDPNRVYLTGISDGGNGAWELAAEYPDRWAALVPISCGISQIHIDRIKKHLPIRWYQNTGDDICNVRNAVNQLKRAGFAAELIEFDDSNHDAWTRAYADPDLYRWLNRHVR
jgi:predicted peptidase